MFLTFVLEMESRMGVALEEFSTITAKGQTTVPKAVRQALGVDYGGRIAFRVGDDDVTVARTRSRVVSTSIRRCEAVSLACRVLE